MKKCLFLIPIAILCNGFPATYYRMGSPPQLTKEEVSLIKNENDGHPVQTEIFTTGSGEYQKTIAIRENDVFLIRLTRLQEPYAFSEK